MKKHKKIIPYKRRRKETKVKDNDDFICRGFMYFFFYCICVLLLLLFANDWFSKASNREFDIFSLYFEVIIVSATFLGSIIVAGIFFRLGRNNK